MTQLSQSEIQELASQSNSPCISLYLPTEKAGAETRKNSIIFKNLLAKAEAKIEAMGKTAEIHDSLEAAKSYLENYDFWQNQASGLAFFIDTKGLKYYQLPESFSETAIVGDRFYLKPLIQVISSDAQFYLLALSQNQVQLFLGDRFGLKELKLPDAVPHSLAEALKYDDPEKTTQYHTGDSGRSPIYHGQGGSKTDSNDEIKRFLQQVDRGLESAFSDETTPLILAGVEYLFPIYRETNSYGNLIETGIPGNPENVAEENLHQQAWEIIQQELAKESENAIANYDSLANTRETTSQLSEIVAAAVKGQIKTLFVSDNKQQWGSFDIQTNQVTIHSEVTDQSVDLYDLAVTNTYLQGGKVYTIDSDTMPGNTSMMAILRYPIYAEVEKVTV